jgi:hypothetical protein
MIRQNLIREPEAWAWMCRRFPWVEEDRGEIGEGLVHLDFAALRRGLERAADADDVSSASEILGFVEELAGKLDELHPDVINALDVSFLEDLYLGEQSRRDFAAPLLRPKTRERWDEIAAAHERLG